MSKDGPPTNDQDPTDADGARGASDSSHETGGSAPWERPEQWEREEADLTQASDLIARLAGSAQRRRRQRDDDEGVSASDLIAALGAAAGPEETVPAEDHPAPAADAPQDSSAASAEDSPGDVPDDIPDDSPGGTPDETPDEFANDISAGETSPDEPLFTSSPLFGADDGFGDPGNDPVDAIVLSDEIEPPYDDQLVGAGAHGGGRHRGWLLASRIGAAALAVVLLIGVGTEWVIKLRADAGLNENQITALDPTTAQPPTPGPTTDAAPALTSSTGAPVPASYEPENILIIGTDARHSDEDIALAGRDDSPGGADVAMVAHFSADRSHVTVVSIPRDMYIPAPTCQAWDGATGEMYDWDFESPYSMWRLTSTYSSGGPKCTVRGVQNISGLRIDRVIVIDFSGFTKIVDSLGGITVNACVPVIDRKLGTVLPVAGKQHITGKQALQLVRARKVQGDAESDLARIRRQQKVMSTMLRDATAANVLLNPVKLDNVLQSFVQSVRTDNVTLDNLLNIAQSLGNLNPKRVTFYTFSTTPDPDGVGLHPDDIADSIWQALREDKPLPGEVTTPPSAETTATPTPVTKLVEYEVVTEETVPADVPKKITVAPTDVDLQVVNVTGRGGVATAAQKKLRPVGYVVADSDLLLPPGQKQSAVTVEYAPDNLAAAVTVAATVPGATMVPVNSLGTKVRLMLGSSYDGTVRDVSVGDKLTSNLANQLRDMLPPTVVKVTSTETSVVVTTPTPETTAPTDDDLATSLTSLNAAAADCI